jgi:hypothetical protein
VARLRPLPYTRGMPRSDDENATRARKYGRRLRVLKAAGSAKDFADVTRDLLAQLKQAGASSQQLARLKANLACSDVRRHSAAVWAILDALEQAERTAPPRRSGRTS